MTSNQEGGDNTESYRVRDDWIELGDTGEEFRRVTLETPDGEVIEYLTTLSPAEYDPIEKAAKAANNDERVFYVGTANDIRERMERHDGFPSRGGANFKATFQPNALVKVSLQETRAAALRHEQKRARELTRPGKSYAYSEQK